MTRLNCEWLLQRNGDKILILFHHLLQACPALPNPADGYVSTPNGTEFEDEAVYTCCDTGLELNGISPRSCLSTGDWSGTEPTCLQIGMAIKLLRKTSFRTIITTWGDQKVMRLAS